MKKIVAFILILNLCFAVSIPALAADFDATQEKSNSEVVTRAEETEWRYRVYNGQKQKRLWSITNERWLTEWMPYNS